MPNRTLATKNRDWTPAGVFRETIPGLGRAVARRAGQLAATNAPFRHLAEDVIMPESWNDRRIGKEIHAPPKAKALDAQNHEERSLAK